MLLFLARSFIPLTFGVIPPAKNVCKLQLIQNFACRIILGKKKKMIMSLLPENPLVGYASVRNFEFKNTVIMVDKRRINQAPPYLRNLFHDRFSVSGRSTRNKSQLNLPKCRL